MAPVARKKGEAAGGSGAAAGGKNKHPSQANKHTRNDDDALLLNGANGRWTDSFIVLCLVRWLAEQMLAVTRQVKGSAPTPVKKKLEKPEMPMKQRILQWLSDFKIPVFIMAVFVLTCAIIAGGEGFGAPDERPKSQADDFYATLGVARDAETADVKRAYKTLARRWHPDKNPNCTVCQETFSKIAEAYETLSDGDKRSAYDESGDIATTELKSPKSVPLTRDNFDELVTFSNDVWIVQIFKPEHKSCSMFHPFWENQIQKYGHLVRFGRIDITNDPGKWLPVKPRSLPMVLKFGRHIGAPEVFPITEMHEIPQKLMKFVLTSFPNIGLPLHQDPKALQRWLSSSTRKHKVLFAVPGKSEEERYKSHLVLRKLASRWSEIFEFRSAETAAIHDLQTGQVPSEVVAALPARDKAAEEAAVLFFPAFGGVSAPGASASLPWPTGEDEIVLELIRLADLVAPTLSARSAELLCRSLAIRRVYCLVLLDPVDSAVTKAVSELRASHAQYAGEVAEMRASGSEVSEDEDNFVVPVLRLYRPSKGLQPSISTCRAPRFGQMEKAAGRATAILMDLDTGRIAGLRLSSYRGIYPQIAYEDSLSWVDDVLHPHLSLPDCDEGILEYFVRSLRNASPVELLLQFLSALVFAETLGKAACEQSWRWCAGAGCLFLLILVRAPPFLRMAAGYLPGFLFAPAPLDL